MEYMIPADDRPQFVDWEAGMVIGDSIPVEIRWWLPAVVPHGGREAPVVIDSNGDMHVFHGRQPHEVGMAPAPYSPHSPHDDAFWPLCGFPSEALTAQLGEPAQIAHRLRDTGWTVAVVDHQLGLVASIPPDGDEPMLWRLAQACTLLGFFPPLGIGFRGDASEFKVGVETLDERPARTVKRAVINRLAHDRRGLRDLSDRIEENWS